MTETPSHLSRIPLAHSDALDRLLRTDMRDVRPVNASRGCGHHAGMTDIAPPKTTEDHADFVMECEFALEPAFQ